jgi:toxin YoeB
MSKPRVIVLSVVQQRLSVTEAADLLIRHIIRNGNEGLGQPEPLNHDFDGYWSRRITDEHRLVYKVRETEIRIAACRYHYGR